MLSVTDSPVDLDGAQVLATFERDVLVVALATAIDEWDRREQVADELGDVNSEVVYRMQANAGRELLAAIKDRHDLVVLTHGDPDA